MRRQHWLPLIVFAACCIALRAAAQVAPADDLASVRTRLTRLEDRLRKAQALRDIKRLQYSYAHYAESGLWLDLGDLFAANGVAHYAQGDYRGPESLRKFYLQELGRGQLGLADGRIYPHIMIQPVVTVADDGKTAKGRWHVIAMLGSYGASASWAGVVYENKYVFEDGVWKISELSYGSQYSGRYNPPGVTVSKWNLPNHFTPQSAGTPVNVALSAPANATPDGTSFEKLQQRWTNLVRSTQQLRDEADVLNLQHDYGYYFDQKMWEAAANLFSTDGTLELGQRGVYLGRGRIRQALNIIGGKRLEDDEVHNHLQLATVVHIAPDGRTAKARGIELSVSGMKEKKAQWEEGIFENEYVRQDGAWKIHSVHYYPRVITDYELGWAKDAKPAAGPSTEFPPDRPPTEVYGIYPKMYYPRFHYNNPVTGRPVQYPTGIAAAESKQSYSDLGPLRAAPKNVKEFTAQLTELERQLQASIAFDAVENLVSAHGYALDDSSLDGSPAIHQTIQPVIHVASNGQSATIRARQLKIGGKAGELAGGKHEGRATITGDTWKLQDFGLKPEWSSPFSTWMPEFDHRR